MLYGWICPVCNKVNAPWVEHCDCNKNTRNSNFSNEVVRSDEDCCKHKWVVTGVSTAGTHYRCAYCGETKTEQYNTDSYARNITNY